MVNAKAKIRSLKLTDSKKIQEFLADVEVAAESNFVSYVNPTDYPFVLRKISAFLPLSLKFTQEVYVALEENKIVGLVSLVPDGKSKSRWKINELCLKNNFFDIGKLLIDYVVNTFGADGVESFLAEVDMSNVDSLNLFKNACGFRECCNSHLFSKNIDGKLPLNNRIENLRDYCSYDSKMVQGLYTESLLPQLRVSLDKDANSFKDSVFTSFMEMFNHSYSKRWVLEGNNSTSIEGFIHFISSDFREIKVFILLSLAYSEYYNEIIDYILYFASLKSKNPNISFVVLDCFQSSKKFKEILKSREIDPLRSYNLLIKDYWRPIKEKKMLPNPMVIFPDSTSPACNSLKVSKLK